MPVIINDKFSHLKGTISRSRLNQLRREARGVCMKCPEKIWKWGLCRKHVLEHSVYKAVLYARKKERAR